MMSLRTAADGHHPLFGRRKATGELLSWGVMDHMDRADSLGHPHAVYEGVREVRPGEYYAEFWMSPIVDAMMLQSAFDDFRMDGACGLSFTVHRIRSFDRPSSMLFLKDDAQDWPWRTLLLPWRTDGTHIEPRIPAAAGELWDPSHARALESAGRVLPRINWGNAYENGKLVRNTRRHVMCVNDVWRPLDDFIDHTFIGNGEDLVQGVFIVHEHTTDVMFPVTDASVLQWRMFMSPTYRETYFNVVGRAIAIRRALAKGLIVQR
ncbi:hypothetical protein [Bifidobacterium criceti]|nr:hypothetical protein [Bifidobacterium criceti]